MWCDLGWDTHIWHPCGSVRTCWIATLRPLDTKFVESSIPTSRFCANSCHGTSSRSQTICCVRSSHLRCPSILCPSPSLLEDTVLLALIPRMVWRHDASRYPNIWDNFVSGHIAAKSDAWLAQRHNAVHTAWSHDGTPLCCHCTRLQEAHRFPKAGRSAPSAGHHRAIRRVILSCSERICCNSCAVQWPLAQEEQGYTENGALVAWLLDCRGCAKMARCCGAPATP